MFLCQNEGCESLNTFTVRSSTLYEGSVSARMALSAGLWSNCDMKFFGVTKSSAFRYLLPTANMFTSTRAQTQSADVTLRLLFSLRLAQMSRPAQAIIMMNDSKASLRIRVMRSATSASTSAPCMPASEAPLKLPASLGKSQNRRQTPPVSAKASRPFFRTSSAGISPRTSLSRKMKPSSGTVTCSTHRAMDTVRNLL